MVIVQFVDCPGHECLMATMMTGAAVMDAAILLVAANASVPQPQTLEHLAGASMIGLEVCSLFTCSVDLASILLLSKTKWIWSHKLKPSKIMSLLGNLFVEPQQKNPQ